MCDFKEILPWKTQKGALKWDEAQLQTMFGSGSFRFAADSLRSKVKNLFDHLDTNFLSVNRDLYPSQRWDYDAFASAYQLVLSRSFVAFFPDLNCDLRVLLPHADLFNHHSEQGV